LKLKETGKVNLTSLKDSSSKCKEVLLEITSFGKHLGNCSSGPIKLILSLKKSYPVTVENGNNAHSLSIDSGA